MNTKQSAKVIVHPATTEFLNQNNAFIYVKPYSTAEMAKIYGVSLKTFSKWLKPFEDEIGEKIGRFYNVRQVKIIFEKLDFPHLMYAA